MIYTTPLAEIDIWITDKSIKRFSTSWALKNASVGGEVVQQVLVLHVAEMVQSTARCDSWASEGMPPPTSPAQTKC